VKKEHKTYNRKLNQLTNKLHIDIGFSTLIYPDFNWVFEDFYVKLDNKNIKFILRDSFNKITAISLTF